jgi:Holliday junction resolvasome RuvABC endonuclease subunit
VWYDQFKDSYYFQITASKSAQRANQKLQELRTEIDELIKKVWDEVEAYFLEENGEEGRVLAATYGVVYVLRSSEKKSQEDPATES